MSSTYLGDRRVEDMDFPGVLKKEHVKIQGISYKRSGITRSVYEKLMWNFHGMGLVFELGISTVFQNRQR